MLDIASNLLEIEARVATAAQRAGREAAEITILAVSKRIEIPLVQAAVEAGAAALGESRVQDAAKRIPQISGDPVWHFIGPLQRNKAAKAARLFDVIHSVDRLPLVDRLSSATVDAGREVGAYVQIERSTDLAAAATVDTTLELCVAVDAAPGLRLDGLMMMPPYDPDPETARPFFRGLRLVRDAIAERASELPPLGLSMGMTGDFEVAIEEGATIVRIGTAIFGRRPT